MYSRKSFVMEAVWSVSSAMDQAMIWPMPFIVPFRVKLSSMTKDEKELHALGECREGGDLRGEVAAVLGDFVEEVVLGGHGLVLQELVVDGLGEPDRLDEVRVGGDVHGLARGERREHHSDLGLTEAREVVVDVGARDVDVALGEEAQDLREEVALAIGELLAVVLDVLEHGTPVQSQCICSDCMKAS